MKRKKLLTVGVALMLAGVPMFSGCEQQMEDFIILALNGFQQAPVPSIKEGRFNFSVTYEVGGEVKTISSVYVCEYVESKLWLDGWSVDWDSYIEDEEIQMLPPENNYNLIIVETNEDGTIYLDLSLIEGYFMSEPGWTHRVFKPYFYIKYNEEASDRIGSNGTEQVEVIESYGVKLISYECDAPVENIYK